MTKVVQATLRVSAENKTKAGLDAAAKELEAFRRRQRQQEKRALSQKNREDALARQAQTQRARGAALTAMAEESRIERQILRRQRADQLGARAAAAYGPGAMMTGAAAGLAARAFVPAAIGLGAVSVVKDFANAERAVTRIGLTADATAEETRAAFGTIEQAAYDYAMAQSEIVGGLDTLVAQGRDLKDAMAFLPAVAATAQASGSAIDDVARTADSVGRNFGIAGENIQSAFDIMVTGGKAGMFELRDMAQYLPQIAPAFTALGYEGEEGLKKLVAMLQQIRVGAGDSAQAASYAMNIFSKMETEETANKFEKFGVDLRKEMQRARDEGRDLIDFFVELSEKTVGGDLSKLPQLFGDMEMAAGMRSMIRNGEVLARVMEELGRAAGATHRDLDRVLSDNLTKLDRLSANWTSLKNNLGEAIAIGANPVFDQLNSYLDRNLSYLRAVEKEEAAGGSEAEARAEYERRWEQENPKPSSILDQPGWRIRRFQAFQNDAAAYGRGEIDTWYSNIGKEDAPATKPSGRTIVLPNGVVVPSRPQAVLPNIDDLETLRTGTPVPGFRDSPAGGGLSLAQQYGLYYSGRMAGESLTTPDALEDRRIRDQAAAADERRRRLEEISNTPSSPQPWISAPSIGLRVGPYTGGDPARQAAADAAWNAQVGEQNAADALQSANDDLRTRLEAAGVTISDAGTSAGDALASGGQEAAGFIEQAAAGIAAAIRSAFGEGGAAAAAQIRGAHQQGAAALRGARVNANLGQSMPDVGTPGQ